MTFQVGRGLAFERTPPREIPPAHPRGPAGAPRRWSRWFRSAEAGPTWKSLRHPGIAQEFLPRTRCRVASVRRYCLGDGIQSGSRPEGTGTGAASRADELNPEARARFWRETPAPFAEKSAPSSRASRCRADKESESSGMARFYERAHVSAMGNPSRTGKAYAGTSCPNSVWVHPCPFAKLSFADKICTELRR